MLKDDVKGVAAIMKMNALQQLALVNDYFALFPDVRDGLKARKKSPTGLELGDVYLAVFLPWLLGVDDSTIAGKEPPMIANPKYDSTKTPEENIDEDGEPIPKEIYKKTKPEHTVWLLNPDFGKKGSFTRGKIKTKISKYWDDGKQGRKNGWYFTPLKDGGKGWLPKDEEPKDK